jgi:hypothetical protein
MTTPTTLEEITRLAIDSDGAGADLGDDRVGDGAVRQRRTRAPLSIL